LHYRVKIKETARNQQKTMTDVCRALDIDPPTLYHWNAGRSFPRIPMFIDLARYLNTTIDALLEEVSPDAEN
jgi:DNA-binding XRE family transcriptional regulator